MRRFAIAVTALIFGIGTAVALDGPGRALVPSTTNLQVSNDAVLTGAAGEEVSRTFIPPYSGIVRVQWEVRSGDGSNVVSTAEVRHLNSCTRNVIGTAFKMKACNIRVTGGMPVTVSASPDQITNTAALRNVRLYYVVRDSDGKAIVYTGAEKEICTDKNWCERRTDTCGPVNGHGKCLLTQFGKNVCAEILFQAANCSDCAAPSCTDCVCALATGGGDKCNNGVNGYPYICVRRVAN
jgi:hypothetical protein